MDCVDVISRVGDAATTASLWTMISEDVERHPGSWTSPAFHGLAVYRLGRWARTAKAPSAVRLLVKIIAGLLNLLVIRNVYGMEISPRAIIGRRVLIGHHQSVHIPANCIIGDGSVLRHNLTIGIRQGDDRPQEVPHLGRDVRIGPGCCLLGPIRIGHGARIGPNCVVMSDVADGATLVPPAPRALKGWQRGPAASRTPP
jgi:serine O-acetyltransferase